MPPSSSSSSAPPPGWCFLAKFLVSTLCLIAATLHFGQNVTEWVKSTTGIHAVDATHTLTHSHNRTDSQSVYVDIVNATIYDVWNISEHNSESTSVDVSERVSERVSKDASKDVSDRAPVDVTDATTLPYSLPHSLPHSPSPSRQSMLLAAIDVNTARWRHVRTQLEYAIHSCNNSDVHLTCSVYTSDRVLYTQQISRQNITTVTITSQCMFTFVPEKSLIYQMLSVTVGLTSNEFDYIAVMMSDTILTPHKSSRVKQHQQVYNNVHIPSFLDTMKGMTLDQASASVLNHKLYSYLRPQSECITRSTAFAELQFTVFTRSSFLCLQRHIGKHIAEYSGITAYAMVFYIVCNASVGILDRQHVGEYCLHVYWVGCVCLVKLKTNVLNVCVRAINRVFGEQAPSIYSTLPTRATVHISLVH